MRKIKYKLPETTYFAMVFPERIDLPPGMHVDIDVVFRPVHNEVRLCSGVLEQASSVSPR